MKRVAIIGTVGVPANYGGFETLVENLLDDECKTNIKYTVFCSSKSYNEKQKKYKNAELIYLPLSANGVQSILYDILSILLALRNHETLLILGVSGCLILPLIRLFSKKRIIVNIDGLEHRREKWNIYIRKFLKWSECIAVKHSDIVVADNKAIQNYVYEEYKVKSELIAYGGDHVEIPQCVKQKDFYLSLCRIEPENNIHLILDTFAHINENIIFIGNWNNSEYGLSLREKYKNKLNIQLLDPIYDLNKLGVLRASCKAYIHGHSAGGTNPSLVESMFFSKDIIAFDVIYNRETTENKALYFKNSDQLKNIISNELNHYHCGDKMYEIAFRRYCWETIKSQYESIY